MNDGVTKAVRQALAEHGNLKQDPLALPSKADLYATGLTSHATIEVVLELEDLLDIEVPDNMLNKATFATIDSIVQVLTPLVEA